MLLAAPLSAQTAYKVVFDQALANDAGSAGQTQSYVTIQNPNDSGGAMDVDSIQLQWNDASSISSPATGILKHDDATNCNILSSHSLAKGEGLTVNVATALQDCTGFEGCDTTTCTSDAQCGDDCRCIKIIYSPDLIIGHCQPKFGETTNAEVSRVTVKVVVDDMGNGRPILEGYDALVDGQGEIFAYREARVETN